MNDIVWSWETRSWNIEISSKKFQYEAKDLNPFTGQEILFNWNRIWGIIISKTDTWIYIDKMELNASYRWQGLWKLIIDCLFQDYEEITLCSVNEAVWFWLKLWAEDFGKSAIVWDRSMKITYNDYVDVSSWRKQHKIKTYYDKPYDQSMEDFDEDWHLYKCIWEDNRLPLWMKLYYPNEFNFDDYFSLWKPENVFDLHDNGNAFILTNPNMKITRYSKVKYESRGDECDWMTKEEIAKHNFDAMECWEMVMIYNTKMIIK